jgi:hypothetical protein
LSITSFFKILLQLFNGFLNAVSNSPLIETHIEFFVRYIFSSCHIVPRSLAFLH